MLLRPAEETDFPEIIDLANVAYRGTEGDAVSWNLERGILEGQRMNESLLREELAQKSDGFLMTWRDQADAPLLGTFWLSPERDGAWHLSLLMVTPTQQNRGLGRELLAAAEAFAKQQGASRIHISVLHVRDTLIAWYERRGYQRTGETEPFPYGDDRFGRPLRDDLYFVIMEKPI